MFFTVPSIIVPWEIPIMANLGLKVDPVNGSVHKKGYLQMPSNGNVKRTHISVECNPMEQATLFWDKPLKNMCITLICTYIYHMLSSTANAHKLKKMRTCIFTLPRWTTKGSGLVAGESGSLLKIRSEIGRIPISIWLITHGSKESSLGSNGAYIYICIYIYSNLQKITENKSTNCLENIVIIEN